MSQFSAVLQPFWMRNLNAVSGNQEKTVKTWLQDGALAFDRAGAAGSWIFHVPDVQTLLNSVACDVNRMAMASFESISGIPSPNDLPRSTAWTLIRLYYAGFFAAHALLRVYGQSVIQVEKAQAASLTRSMRLSGQTGIVQEGLWLLSVDQASHTFQISPLLKGSHLDTWTVLGARVKELKTGAASSVIAAANDRQDVALVLDDIETILRTPPAHSAANWLSYMRNQLNYQHAHGAWYPHQRSSRFRNSVIEQLGRWREAPSIALPRSPHILHRFTACNVAIVAWMRETMLRLCDKHPDNDSFLKYGAVRVLNQCG